jgi:hypothetical protein
MVTTSLIMASWVDTCRARLKAALTGLEKLTDAEAAAYLTNHPGAIDRIASMPITITTAMVSEVRKS